MKYINKLLFIPLFLLVALQLKAFNHIDTTSRMLIPFNQGWTYYDAYNFSQGIAKEKVTLPHTWNADAPLKEVADYKRSTGIYENTITFKKEWKNKRIFLFFEGANSVANVFVNNRFVAEHKGGYTAFCLEISSFLTAGENKVKVLVSNALRLDVLPITGDFNVYGGLHRPVSLLITNPDCISPLDYASSGVYISPKKVSEKEAELTITTKLSFTQKLNGFLHTSIMDQKGKRVAEQTSPVNDTTLHQNFKLKNPQLWNGKVNPYLYKVKTELLQNNQVLDEVIQPLGLRYFHVDPDKGFFLNGKYLDLHGFGRHADVYGKGSALTKEDYDRDMDLIMEIGATALRLTHYPYIDYVYQQADKNGIVLWSEIPQVGPGGYTAIGFVNSPDYKAHAKQVLTELIRQNYNHPSIFFWGLLNELNLNDHPEPFIKELNELAKKEDPYRLTTLASNVGDKDFNGVSDLMAWNQYKGWYGGVFEDIGTWADQIHKTLPKTPIALSEFGAGASPFKHQEQLEKVNASGKFHPEEWQTAFHEKHWELLKSRPFIWAKFIWLLNDFGSSIRTEGDHNGINDKGLVTYDRKIKKDAFYFYKANWNPEPMIYLAEKRNKERKNANTSIKAFANIPSAVALWVNGKLIGAKNKNDINIITWDHISLQNGVNKIKIKAKFNGKILEDSTLIMVKN